jgi:FdhD protein
MDDTSTGAVDQEFIAPEPLNEVSRWSWRNGSAQEGVRAVPEETAIAFTYDGGSYAVMMATPHDLEDFAFGFSRTEGVITSAQDVVSLDVIPHEEGVELRIWLKKSTASALRDRRRHIAGPVGCGLCGIESLTEAMAVPNKVEGDIRVSAATITQALNDLSDAQIMNREARAMHAAGFYVPGQGLVFAREDVGRHNALDKLAGALFRQNMAGSQGFVVVTSRLSVEMVQKTAKIGAPLLVAVSAPTALAIRTARAAGITLVAIARGADFEVFTYPERVLGLG